MSDNKTDTPRNSFIFLISFTEFKGAKNLEQEQIEEAIGDRTTHLPDYIEAPTHWQQSG